MPVLVPCITTVPNHPNPSAQLLLNTSFIRAYSAGNFNPVSSTGNRTWTGDASLEAHLGYADLLAPRQMLHGTSNLTPSQFRI